MWFGGIVYAWFQLYIKFVYMILYIVMWIISTVRHWYWSASAIICTIIIYIYYFFYVNCYSFWPTYLGFLKLGSFGSAATRLVWCFGVSAPRRCLWILDRTCCLRTPLCHFLNLYQNRPWVSSRLFNWLLLCCLVLWINHLLPTCTCWSILWKASLKWSWVKST